MAQEGEVWIGHQRLLLLLLPPTATPASPGGADEQISLLPLPRALSERSALSGLLPLPLRAAPDEI